MSYIGWVQAGGAWALRVLPFQICPRVCLLLMRLPQPGDPPSAFPGLSCGLFFRSFTPIRSWALYDNGLYISLAHLWFSLLPAALARNSCRNDSILLDPFLGRPFYSFSQWPITGTVLFLFFTHGLLCPLVFFFLLGIHGPFANPTLPWALLLTSLGFPGPITLSLFLGFMSLP